MDVLWVSPSGIEEHHVDDVKSLLTREDAGFLWVDIPEWDDSSERLLAEVFHFHPQAVRDCLERSHVPKIHAYPDHIFLILHAPEAGKPGHVHLLELDQFVSLRYLVTVHGPLGTGVPVESALRETQGARGRIESGRLHPSTPAELSHAIVAALARKQEAFVSNLATKVAALERWALEGEARNPEQALEELFRVRHELLTVRTMAAQSREVYARMVALARFLPSEAQSVVEDLADHFDRIRSLCEGEKDFLQGVVDFYQSRTTTKMNIAMERLALIAALVLPLTAVASIYGMNIIVNTRTDPLQLGVVLFAMLVVSVTMLFWAKRKGWW